MRLVLEEFFFLRSTIVFIIHDFFGILIDSFLYNFERLNHLKSSFQDFFQFEVDEILFIGLKVFTLIRLSYGILFYFIFPRDCFPLKSQNSYFSSFYYKKVQDHLWFFSHHFGWEKKDFYSFPFANEEESENHWKSLDQNFLEASLIIFFHIALLKKVMMLQLSNILAYTFMEWRIFQCLLFRQDLRWSVQLIYADRVFFSTSNWVKVKFLFSKIVGFFYQTTFKSRKIKFSWNEQFIE